MVFLHKTRDQFHKWMGYGTLEIHVLDVNDNTPQFGEVVYNVAQPIPENIPVSTVVATVNASDADLGSNAEFSYAISPPQPRFSINSMTGEISVAQSLDHETTMSYNLTITAVDNGSPSLTGTVFVAIEVSPVNDNAPDCKPTDRLALLPEDQLNGTDFFIVNVRDIDQGANHSVLSFFMSPTDRFNIRKLSDMQAAIYTTVDNFNRRVTSEYNVMVTVTDAGGLSCNIDLLVRVAEPSRFDFTIEGDGYLSGSVKPRPSEDGYNQEIAFFPGTEPSGTVTGRLGTMSAEASYEKVRQPPTEIRTVLHSTEIWFDNPVVTGVSQQRDSLFSTATEPAPISLVISLVGGSGSIITGPSCRPTDSTGLCAMSVAEASLLLSNGSNLNVTSVTNFLITSGNASYIELLDSIVRVSNTSEVTEGEVISITAKLNQLANTANITITTSSLTVTQATIQFPDLLSGTNGSVTVADCSVTFEDNTRLVSTFDEKGAPLYNSLVSFSTSDPSLASVVPTTSNVTLHANSRAPVDLICNASNIIVSNSFFCNLIASEREVDLGNNVGRPLEPTPPNSLVNLSLYLTSDDNSVGVFEVVVTYDPEKVSFMTANQGLDWLRGTIVVAETRNNTLRVGGVLNRGVRGTQQEIGMLQFAVMGQTGVAEFTAFPSLLATADLNLTNILEEGSITPAVVQLEITNSVQRRSVPAENSVTKSTSSRRVRRQTDNDACTGPYPTGDINGDCDVDLRDSYYFQEYIQAEVHNFTGSDKGAAIQENINSKNINLDVDGDGIVSLVDIVTVEQVSIGLVYELDFNSPYINRQLCNCKFNFNGTVTLANGAGVCCHLVRNIFVDRYWVVPNRAKISRG